MKYNHKVVHAIMALAMLTSLICGLVVFLELPPSYRGAVMVMAILLIWLVVVTQKPGDRE